MPKIISRILLSLLLFCVGITTQAVESSRWTPYLSYYDGKELVRDGRYLYALMGSNLLVCDIVAKTSTPITRISHGLARKSIAHIGFSHKRKTLVLLYDDGFVDLLRLQTGEVLHFPHLVDSQKEDLVARRLRVQDDHAFVTTNKGFLWIDLAQSFVRGHFDVGQCEDVALWGTHLFAAYGGKFYHIDRRGNLNDLSQWTLALNAHVNAIAPSAQTLFVSLDPDQGANAGLWSISAPSLQAVDNTAAQVAPSAGWQHFDKEYRGNQLRIDTEGQLLAYQQGRITRVAPANIAAFSRTSIPAEAQCADTDGQGGWWLGFSDKGIVRRPVDAAEWSADKATQYFGRTGPRYDLAYFMRYRGEDLLIACGRLDPYDRESHPQMSEILSHNIWTFLSSPSAAEGYVGTNFENATCIDRNPLNPQQYAVTTSRTGVYLYDGNRITKQFTYTNSPLVSAEKRVVHAFKNYVRTDGAIYDAKGYLFFINNSADTALHFISPKGEWGKIYLKDIDNAPTLEKIMIDSKGRMWIVSRRGTHEHKSGFLCLDYNGTPAYTRDDIVTFRSSFNNQDGETIHPGYAMAIVEDRDSAIWLGTSKGLFRVDNPDKWSHRDFNVTQIKIPRNDGTNLADYLLAGVSISALAVDGANRKWVGTLDNGVYVLSPDALTVENHFTVENSPLFSNEIWSIACHPTSGEVMIGTSKGLMSYQAHVSLPATALRNDNIRVYPNPVRPDYSGQITLDGLVTDAEVRVVTEDGHLVTHGKSLGGTFTWDGRTPNGERAASGVYYFYITAQNGAQHAVAKVAFVR